MMRALAGCLLLLGAAPALAQAPSRFDGTWDVTLICADLPDGVRGYTWRFVATVQDGRLVADNVATQAGGGQIHLEGPIRRDGSARLRAEGTVGNPNNAARRAASGSSFRYTVEAQFDERSGTGRRMQTRPCDFTFAKR